SGRKRPLPDKSEDQTAPKKKGRAAKSTAPASSSAPAAAAAGSASLSQQDWEEVDRRMLAHTKSIMFAAGDSIEPHESNARMMVGLMRQQVRMIVDGAVERAKQKGREDVFLQDFLEHFARHKMVLGRLLNHARAAHSILSLTRQTTSTVKDNDEEDEEEGEEKDEDGVPREVEGLGSESEEEEAEGDGEQPGPLILRASKNSTYVQLEAAIDALQAGFTSSDLTDPALFTDLTREARQRRMATRVKRLREDVYMQFSEARAAAFVPRGRRQKKVSGLTESEYFILWLGLPSVSGALVYVLGWLAKEIITQVVDDAYMCLLKEISAGVIPSRGAVSARLSYRHYEEALRKNLGWRTRADVLFGYIAPRE
ncbi:hypothetical protein PFISCL1PPCAC_23086, partial [Pristionchus fissidentatus]